MIVLYQLTAKRTSLFAVMSGKLSKKQIHIFVFVLFRCFYPQELVCSHHQNLNQLNL